MKLYGAGTANVHRALLVLFEKEVWDVELVHVNLLAGEHMKPWYQAMQPFHQIPLLEDCDFRLYESRAIIRYIAEKYEGQGAPLLGKTLKERALVNQWVEVEGQNFFAPYEAISLESFKAFYFKRPLDKQLVTSNFEKLEKVFNVYEAQLSRNKYLAGDHYSIADLVHTPSLHRLKRVDVNAFAKWKHVTAWYEDIRSRPAFQKVLEWDSKWPFVKAE
jgi:glutathione S-transferase